MKIKVTNKFGSNNINCVDETKNIKTVQILNRSLLV